MEYGNTLKLLHCFKYFPRSQFRFIKIALKFIFDKKLITSELTSLLDKKLQCHTGVL